MSGPRILLVNHFAFLGINISSNLRLSYGVDFYFNAQDALRSAQTTRDYSVCLMDYSGLDSSSEALVREFKRAHPGKPVWTYGVKPLEGAPFGSDEYVLATTRDEILGALFSRLDEEFS